MSLLRERLQKAKHEPNAVQRYVSRRAFRAFERLGFHVVGNHFYEPVPDTRLVAAAYSDAPRKHLGIDFRGDTAGAELARLIEAHAPGFPDALSYGFAEGNHLFSGLDAVTLFSVVREWRPRRVVEIGSGYSTTVLAAALARNAADGDASNLVSIDPFARHAPARDPDGVTVEHLRTDLQSAPESAYGDLQAGDLLLVDSSHVHKFGSDVEFQFERVYPALAPGVRVHVHDIFSPYLYPLAWYTRARRFWNEQSYLELLLREPSPFRVLYPVHALARESDELRETCSRVCTWDGYRHRGSSFYLERVA